MSGEGFRVDPPSLRSAGQGISGSAEQVAQRLSEFRQTLAGHGEPWGSDDLGSLIGQVYQAIADLAMECIQDNVAELATYGQGVGTMAETYQAVDRDVDDGVRRITHGPG